jgi:L-serine kinase (ADP)
MVHGGPGVGYAGPTAVMTTSDTPRASRPGVRLMDIASLKAHEQVKPKKAAQLARHMRRSRIMPKPILVDAETGVILDGHHRYWACREVGCRRVPCVAVDYVRDARITVAPRRPGVLVTKEEVIRRALEGHLYPPKSTKHEQTLPEMEEEYGLGELL